METADGPETGATERPDALPPEVAAELRRRRESGPAATTEDPPELSSTVPAAPTAPWLQPSYLQTADAPAAPAPAAPPAAPARPGVQARLARLGPLGAFLAYLLGKVKYLGFALKFGLPALKTGGTMLLSILLYARVFGWWFAVGFVLCIFVHEMGHVYVAWRLGVPVSAPIFIPGFGALILQKRQARSAWDGALIGIGGPVAGTLAGLACLVFYGMTGRRLMLALADTAFFLNLFNLAPIYPMDGGRITGAVSPRIWLFGILGMIAAFLTGFVRNPLLFVLVLLSGPRLWRGLKTGDITPQGGEPTTPRQRMTMGLCYVALAALLVWLMAQTSRV